MSYHHILKHWTALKQHILRGGKMAFWMQVGFFKRQPVSLKKTSCSSWDKQPSNDAMEVRWSPVKGGFQACLPSGIPYASFPGVTKLVPRLLGNPFLSVNSLLCVQGAELPSSIQCIHFKLAYVIPFLHMNSSRLKKKVEMQKHNHGVGFRVFF